MQSIIFNTIQDFLVDEIVSSERCDVIVHCQWLRMNARAYPSLNFNTYSPAVSRVEAR